MVTGASGFIGSWLVPELREARFDVVAIDFPDGDLSIPGVFDAMLDQWKPDVVVHLAARPVILWVEEHPMEAIVHNVGMTTLVARACGARGIKLVYASSSEVYGEMAEGVMRREDSPVGKPQNLYAACKLWGEQMTELYTKDPLIIRISMPTGPHLTAGHMNEHRAAVVKFLWLALHRQPIIVHRGTERALCWIGDTVQAIRMLVEQGRTGIYNEGREDRVTMREIAELACELTGAPTSLIQEVDPPAIRTIIKNLSMDKIRAIGWEPKVGLREIVERTLEWVKTLPPTS